MPELRSLWTGDTARGRGIGLAGIVLLALAIRLAAWTVAYPAPADVVHYVQAASQLARGGWHVWPAVFSPGPLLLATEAERIGLPSARVLQMLSLVCGVLAAAGFTLLASRVMGRWACGLLTGVFVATNPSLVYYSVNGYSEVPYLALLSLVGLLVHDGFFRAGGHRFRGVLAFAALGVAAYFRTDEAHALALALAAVALLIAVRRRDRLLAASAIQGLLVFAALVLPIYLLTFFATGRFAPGTKYASLAVGDAAYDSKQYNSLHKPWEPDMDRIRLQGPVEYALEHKRDLAVRWVRNAGRSIRTINEELTVGAFRAGTGWFFSVVLVGGYMAWRMRRVGAWAFSLLFILVPVSLISLFMCQSRYLLQTLPFAFILASDLVVEAVDRVRGRAGIGIAVLLAVYFFAKTAVWAVDYTAETAWYFLNGQRAGEALRAYGTDENVLMTQQYCVTLHFHDRYPERLAMLPYGTIDETEQYAADHNVDLIAISDSQYPHWPINALFHGSAAPANWVLLKEMKFDRISPFYGPIEEKYFLYRRTPSADSPSTK